MDLKKALLYILPWAHSLTDPPTPKNTLLKLLLSKTIQSN